ncbi:HEAT repeat domain-containing protein [Paenibacillus sp. JX-17]|uniref:HEAT repeat domain-containing protein n=1 Tax=Paenibacillus lacisoli TaxID=3064525 RepID=A0ABT9CBV2_9BACL|nr:HEAT repeat domain-containing protein [Paenibacillus sp. JX-17]MDO7906737.1 HEAT repeat domain-containing protein [Paenibacillus sp. JX-17]
MRWLETFMEWMIGLSVVLFVFLLLMLVALLFRNCRHTSKLDQRERRYRWLMEEDSPLDRFVKTGAESRHLHLRSGESVPAIEQALLESLSRVQNWEERARIEHFAEGLLLDDYKASLQSRRWNRRVKALQAIEKFRISGMNDHLKILMERSISTPIEQFKIRRILARSGDSSITEPEYWKHTEAAEIQQLQLLLPLPPNCWDRLLLYWKEYPLGVQCSMVDALRMLNVRTAEVLSIFEQGLLSTEDELRIRSLKALANFGYMTPEGLQYLQQLLEQKREPSVLERLMRAKLMGSIREDDFLPRLELLLGDPSLLVRQQAGEALARYQGGMEELERLAALHPDLYAREMAEETLERKHYEWKMA